MVLDHPSIPFTIPDSTRTIYGGTRRCLGVRIEVEIGVSGRIEGLGLDVYNLYKLGLKRV